MHQPELYANISRKIFQQRSSDVTNLLDSLTWSEDSDRTAKVLDVGCGPGDYTSRDLVPRLWERQKNCTVVGVDSELSMVRYASEHYAKPGVLSFYQVDIATHHIETTDLWKEMAPFDKFFSYYCLHWVKDQRQAVKNLFKLLSDEHGEAILVFVAKDGIAKAYRNLSRTSRWRNYLQDCEKYVWAYQDSMDPEKDFRDLMEETGFTVETCVCETRYYSYRTKEEVTELLSSINPFLNRIPEEDRSDFLQDLVSECFETQFLKKSHLDGLEYVGSAKALIVKAHKYKQL